MLHSFNFLEEGTCRKRRKVHITSIQATSLAISTPTAIATNQAKRRCRDPITIIPDISPAIWIRMAIGTKAVGDKQ